MGKKIKLPLYTCIILLLPVLCHCKDVSVLCQDNGDMLIIEERNIPELANCLNEAELPCEDVNNQSTVNITVKITNVVHAFNFSYTLFCGTSTENNTRCYKCSQISSSKVLSNSTCDIWNSLVNESVAYTVVKDPPNTFCDPSIVDQSTFTSFIVDQSIITTFTVDQSTFTSFIVDQSTFTSFIVGQSDLTSSLIEPSTLVDQPTYPFFIDDTTYLPTPDASSSTVSFSYTESLSEVLQSSELSEIPSGSLDSGLSTDLQWTTALDSAQTLSALASASETASDMIGQPEITKTSDLHETSTGTTLVSSFDKSRSQFLSTGSVFTSTPFLQDSLTATSYSSSEFTFTAQQSTTAETTVNFSSSKTPGSSLEFTLTTLSTAELYEASSIQRHESELSSASINGSVFLSLTQSIETINDLFTSVFIETSENNTIAISRTNELFAKSSSLSEFFIFEIGSSKSMTSFDASVVISNYPTTSSIGLTTQTTSGYKMSITSSSSEAMTQLHVVTATASASVIGDDSTTHSSIRNNSTSPVIAESTHSTEQLVPIVLGVVLGTVVAVVLVVLLCLYVRHKKRTKLESRAQRFKTSGYRNWKDLKEKKKPLTSEEHVTLPELVSTGKANDTFIRNSFDSFHGLDLPGGKLTLDKEHPQNQTSCVDNPETTLSLALRQEKTASKSLAHGVDDRLDVGTIISGLNNNIQHKNNNVVRKSNVLNLEDVKRNNQVHAGQNLEGIVRKHPINIDEGIVRKHPINIDEGIVRKHPINVDEIKHKADLRKSSAMHSIYSEIKDGDVNKKSIAVRPSLSDVYTTIDEKDAMHNEPHMDSLYDEVEETGNPAIENIYSSVRKDNRGRNESTFSSVSTPYGVSRISDYSVSGISERADSMRNSHLYEYVSYTCSKEVGENHDSEQKSIYSSLGHILREPLNHYNNPSGIHEITVPAEESRNEPKLYEEQFPKTPSSLHSADPETKTGDRLMNSGPRESGLRQTGENIYFVLEKDDVLG